MVKKVKLWKGLASAGTEFPLLEVWSVSWLYQKTKQEGIQSENMGWIR